MKTYRLRQILVVLMIVVMTASVLLPVLRRHQEEERSSTCTSNLQMIGKALSQYLADNDETYPPAYETSYDDDNQPRNQAWTYYLSPYIEPSISGYEGWVIGTGWGTVDNVAGEDSGDSDHAASGPWRCPNDPNTTVLSYGLNPMVSGAYKYFGVRNKYPECESQISLRTNDILNPAQIVWGGDTNRFWDAKRNRYVAVFPEWPRRTDLYLRQLTKPKFVAWYRAFLARDFTDIKDRCPYPLAWGCRAPSYRHGRHGNGTGASTMLFCDGHARSVPFGKLTVENVFPNISPQDLAAPPIKTSTYPYCIVDLVGFDNEVFHAGAINDAGFVASASAGHLLGFQAGKLMDLRRPKMADVGTCAYAVNAEGEIAGDFNSEGNTYGFLWLHGRYRNIKYPTGYDGYEVRGLNQNEQVVGRAYRVSSKAFDGASRAFLWEKGKFYDLGVPPRCISSAAYAINDKGQIVGSAVTRDKHTHAFLWQNGVMRDIGLLPGGTLAMAYGINNNGQIVGDSNAGNENVKRMHPVIWENGSIRDIGIPAHCGMSIAKAISDTGQVATLISDTDGVPLDIGLWDKQHGLKFVTSLYPPDSGWLLRDVYSINNKGQFLCRGFHGPNSNCMALLTPIDTYAVQCATKEMKDK